MGGRVAVLGRALTCVACAALALSGHISAPSTMGADDTGCVVAGQVLRYVVDFDRGTAASSAAAEVSAACGEITFYYPEIAVGVAASADPGFAQRFGTDRAFSAQAERLATQRANGATSPKSPSPRPELRPTDPAAVPAPDRTAEQWDMRAINAESAHSINAGSRDVVVGVLDSGIDPAHPELTHALTPELSAGCLTGAPDRDAKAWAATSSAHGTHVAGTIAAADDAKGVTGVAPGVRLASVKVIDDRGHVDPEAAVCGLMWAAKQRMKVTNSSFFVDPWALSCTHGEDHRVVREVMSRAVAYSTEAGTLNVAAATNEAVNLTRSPRADTPPARTSAIVGCEALPAGLRDVVAVSSVGVTRLKAGYSSYGLGVIDVTAPGGEAGNCVPSTVPGGYASLCGTSMAAPHVAGVLALMASAHPDYTPRQLRTALDQDATPIACPADYDLTGDGTQDAYCAGYEAYNGFYGHGMVDALAAVAPRMPKLNPVG
jgi:subtilisin family serine protease